MAINPSVLSTALGMINDIGQELPKKDPNAGTVHNGLDRSSIMKASKDLIMSFPVICSDTITPQTAIMITKAVERNCVTTLQLLFSSAYLSGSNGREILKQWHNNMDNSFNMDDYLDLSDSISANIKKNFGESADSTAAIARQMQQSLLTEQKEYYEPNFNESAITDFKSVYKYDGTRTIVKEDLASDKFDYQKQRDAAADQAQAEKNSIEQQRINRQYNELNASEKAKAAQEEKKFTLDHFTKQLLDSDVKKCNELVPSLIVVRFIASGTATTVNNAIEQQFVAGVKARLIPCSSEDIISHLRSAIKNRVSLLNFLRATTKEISFAKDFILAIDQAKIDAKNNSSRLSKTSPIWRSLQSRSTASGLSRLKKNRQNEAGAITTLCVTREEVNALKKDYNIDIDVPKVAIALMNAYNLMCLIVVDEDIEVAKFLMDGDAYFTDYSFNSLERETGDGSYKKIINLISRVNRG